MMKTRTVFAKAGTAQGTYQNGVYAWKGIPYAKAPVGSLRFRHAQPHGGWEGTLDAAAYGSACPQDGSHAKHKSEDCLTLNIWAPVDAARKKAVLFYIHGGSFCRGAGSESRYKGAKLCKNGDVVVVTVNYRLGALDFLDFSFLDDTFEPNCGLSDIVQALRWVHENIKAFGGDPDNITVIGQSAGANAVSALITMPAAKPYISKAVMMSGSPVWMHQKKDAQDIARRFMEFMEIPTKEELMQIPTDRLVEKQTVFLRQSGLGDGTFAIEIDGEFVPEYPLPAVEAGAAAGIPLLVGTTRDEMSFSCKKLLDGIMTVKDIALAVLSREKKDLRERLKECYDQYGLRGQSQFVTDQIFRMSSIWFAQASAKHSDTWAYSFDYETLLMKLTTLGACHSSDIPYLFGNYGALRCAFMFLMSPVQKVIRRISAVLQQDFVTFAKTGRLDWASCSENAVPAKSYHVKTKVAPMVDPAICREYDKSKFKKQSYRGAYSTT